LRQFLPVFSLFIHLIKSTPNILAAGSVTGPAVTGVAEFLPDFLPDFWPENASNIYSWDSHGIAVG